MKAPVSSSFTVVLEIQLDQWIVRDFVLVLDVGSRGSCKTYGVRRVDAAMLLLFLAVLRCLLMQSTDI